MKILKSQLRQYIKEIIDEVIEKQGNQYIVKSKSGKTLGTHPTKKKAQKQLSAIHFSQNK